MRTVKCDACHIADAYVMAHKDRKVLCLCLHHGVLHCKALQQQGWTVLYKEGGKK